MLNKFYALTVFLLVFVNSEAFAQNDPSNTAQPFFSKWTYSGVTPVPNNTTPAVDGAIENGIKVKCAQVRIPAAGNWWAVDIDMAIIETFDRCGFFFGATATLTGAAGGPRTSGGTQMFEIRNYAIVSLDANTDATTDSATYTAKARIYKATPGEGIELATLVTELIDGETFTLPVGRYWIAYYAGQPLASPSIGSMVLIEGVKE